MYTFKEKVSERLSRLLQDTPDSSSPTSTPRDLQAMADSLEGKSLSSYFSHINLSSVFSGSKSSKQLHNLQPIQSTPLRYSDIKYGFLEEHFDNFVDCNPGCRTEETIITTRDDDRGSGRSFSGSEQFEEAIEQHSPQKTLTYLTEDSIFISKDLYGFFLSCLPNIVKGCKWVLLYSTLKHGISLRTLIRKSSDLSGPCLLIVGDKQGAVFGGLLECPLKPTAKRKYQDDNCCIDREQTKHLSFLPYMVNQDSLDQQGPTATFISVWTIH